MYIENESHNNMCATIKCFKKHHIVLVKVYVVLFLYYLFKIITKVIIKTNAMNVIAISPKTNSIIYCIKIDSIIAPPPFLQ